MGPVLPTALSGSAVQQWLEGECGVPAADAATYSEKLATEGVDTVADLEYLDESQWAELIHRPIHRKKLWRSSMSSKPRHKSRQSQLDSKVHQRSRSHQRLQWHMD